MHSSAFRLVTMSLWLAFLTACWPKSDGGGADPRPSEPPSECFRLETEFLDAVAEIPTSCEVAADCVTAGGTIRLCDATASAGPCAGLGVNATAYRGSAAEQAYDVFHTTCFFAACGTEAVCETCDDSDVDCVGGVCVVIPAATTACDPQDAGPVASGRM